MQYYDTTNLQDTPKDIKDFQLVPYNAQRHYPVFDGNDSSIPFVESIPVDKTTEEEGEGVETRDYEGGRVQHIRLHNVSFADAIRFRLLII